MGRVNSVVSVEELIDMNVSEYVKDATARYSNFLESAPTFVSYFSRSKFASDFDVPFTAYNESVGEESPSGYYRIDNFPLYDLQQADFGTSQSDNGIQSEIETTAIIIPDTVIPMYEDQVEISRNSKKYLFTVMNVEADNYNNQKFYKITLRISNYKVDEILRQVVKELEVDFKLIGRSTNPVLPKSHADSVKQIRLVFDDVFACFRERFYVEANMVFLSGSTVDQYLNKFLIDNKLTERYQSLRTSTRINPTVLKYASGQTYRKSIFYYLQNNLMDVSKLPTTQNTFQIVSMAGLTGDYGYNFYIQKKQSFVDYLYDGTPLDVRQTLLDTFNTQIFRTPADGLTEDPNEIFFIKYLDWKRNATDSDKLDTVLDAIHTIEDRYTDSSSELKIASSDFYLTSFLLFALKDIFKHISNAE
jgi:hypothetical protein